MANTSWSTTDLLHATLSGSNLTATGSGIISSGGGVRSVDAQFSGKYYWEVTATTWTIVGTGVGISLPGANFTTLGNTGTGGAMLGHNGNINVNGTNVVTGGGTQTSGTVVNLAIDLTAGLFWAKSTVMVNWNNSGTANPATGTGGVSLAALGGAHNLYPAVNVGSNGEALTANFGDSAFSGAVPTGFTAGFPSPGAPNAAQATQIGLEQWAQGTPGAQLTQAAIEMWAPGGTTTPLAVMTQMALEQWASVMASAGQQARAMILA